MPNPVLFKFPPGHHRRALYPTDPFTFFSLKVCRSTLLELCKIRQSRDIWALKLRKGRPGSSLFRTKWNQGELYV